MLTPGPARDLEIPRALTQAFGHSECGVYAEVVSGGEIAVADRLRPAASS